MREAALAGVPIRLEAAEAGGRYLAPIVILPGLFHSAVCWRGVTSMLAHRGWNVYIVPRSTERGNGDASTAADGGWQSAVDDAVRVAGALGDKLIVLGADVGAAVALAMLDRVRPLALGLFSPAEPAHVGRAFEAGLGLLARRRMRSRPGPVAPPAGLAKRKYRDTDLAPEPRQLLDDLRAGVSFSRPAEHPPMIVFAPDDDPLVELEQAVAFAHTPYAKLARARLAGRWWPSSRWEPIVDEVHRFLILTLADRVVEFPEEILGE